MSSSAPELASRLQLVSQLQAICGHEHVLTHPHELATYRSDGLAHYRQVPVAAVLPGSGNVRLSWDYPVADRALGYFDALTPHTAFSRSVRITLH